MQPDTPLWLRLTVRAALRERHMLRLFKIRREQMIARSAALMRFLDTLDSREGFVPEMDRKEARRLQRDAYREGRRKRQAGREQNVGQQVQNLRRQAMIAANKAGVTGEEFRRVWKPLTFSDPMFTHTAQMYRAVDLEALRRDWRGELARLAQVNDPSTYAVKTIHANIYKEA